MAPCFFHDTMTFPVRFDRKHRGLFQPHPPHMLWADASPRPHHLHFGGVLNEHEICEENMMLMMLTEISKIFHKVSVNHTLWFFYHCFHHSLEVDFFVSRLGGSFPHVSSGSVAGDPCSGLCSVYIQLTVHFTADGLERLLSFETKRSEERYILRTSTSTGTHGI